MLRNFAKKRIMVKKWSLFALFPLLSMIAQAQELYVNSSLGNDTNAGTAKQPLKTLNEAVRRINIDNTKGAATIICAEGVYPLTETVLVNNDKFSRENRLTIRAGVMPGDVNWNPQRMPIIATMIPGKPTPGDGEEAKGIDVEVSHVTIEGLRFTGSPAYYYIDERQSRRYYPVWREGQNLDDLVVTQCLFAGNVDVMPIRVAVIAKGNGLVVDHCVFFNCQNSVVFWDGEAGKSNQNVMRYCLVYGSNYSGVWTTTSTGNDFEFHHNIIANSRTGWIRDNGSIHVYQIHDCIITDNGKFTGNGGDKAIGDDFLQKDNVRLSGKIEIEKDQGKNNYLQLKEGSFGFELNAGLIKK